MAKTNNNNDFFQLLEIERQEEDPLDGAEIIFRDQSGEMKILKDGQIIDAEMPEIKTVLKPIGALPKITPPKTDSVSTGGLKQTAVNQYQPVKSRPKITGARGLDDLALAQARQNVVKKSNLNFSDPQLAKRFNNIIISRLKNIRDKIEIREILAETAAAGGLGLDPQTVSRVQDFLNQEFAKISGQDLPKINQVKAGLLPARMSEPELSLLKAPVINPGVSAGKTEFSLKPKSVVESLHPTLPASSVSVKPPVRKAAPEFISAPKKDFSALIPPQKSGKETAAIKFKPRLLDPIEEIRTMTLVDFRQLAKTAKEAARKILGKIDLLEQESFIKRNQAIIAWKENEVYQLYLDLVSQSLAEKKPLLAVLADKEKLGAATLSREELEAVTDLNYQIRY